MANPVWEVLQPLTPWTLIRANQNGDLPPKPYATYRVASGAPVGFMHGPLGADGVAKLYGPVSLRCEMNFFGPGAEAQARRVRMMLGTEASKDLMLSRNMSLARFVSLTDASGVVDDPQSQERAVLEFALNATDVADDMLGVIEHVAISPDPDLAPDDPAWTHAGCEEIVTSPGATTPPPQ